MLIKICGISDVETAEFAAKNGANYIGVVLHPNSKRYVDIEQATEIAAVAHQLGATPVAVIVNMNTEEIIQMSETTKIKTIQLHGPRVRKRQDLLPADIQRFYVCDVDAKGHLTNPDELNAQELNLQRDFLLFDNIQAGSGKTYNWDNFSYAGNFRWFLSGGLTPDNVKAAIKKLKPTAVDVSSGVEKTPGKKDLQLILDFIENARNDE